MFDSLERSLHRMMIANTVHVVFWTRVEAIQVRESKILFRESFAKLTYYASSFCTIGIISAKVPRKLHEAGGPWSLSHVINYFPNSQQSVMRTGSVILAACFLSYHEVIHDHVAGNDWVFIRGIVSPHGSRQR